MSNKIINNLTFATVAAMAVVSSLVSTVSAANTVKLDEVSQYDFASTKAIAIRPCENEIDTNISQTKAWILRNVEPGTSNEACVMVANATEENKSINVEVLDALPTADGAFGLSSADGELASFGKWIDLGDQQGVHEIEAGQGKRLTFKINVPSDASAGEYAAVIAINEVASGETQGNFKILKRFGNRIYTTVKPDDELTIGTEFNEFDFILPGHKDYDQYAANARAYAWDDMVMTWDFKVSGNIFTKQKGTLTFTNPTGQSATREFSADYFPQDNLNIPYVTVPGAKWTTPGKYKARFDFRHEVTVPWNKPSDVKDVSPIDFVETEIDVTQEMLDKLKAEKNSLERNAKKTDSDNPTSATGFSGEAQLPQTGGDEETDNTLLYIVSGIGGAIVILLIVVIVMMAKKKSSETSEEDTKKSKKTKK